MQEIFILSTVQSWYHHTEYHPQQYYVSLYRGNSASTSIASKEGFSISFDVKWHAESAIYAKKSSFLSFHSFLLLSRSNRVKFTEFDKGEWGEKCHYASDILFNCSHVSFVILLSYYFILSECGFLWEFLPTLLDTILPLKSKLSEKFQLLMLCMEVSECRNIVEFLKLSIKIKNYKICCEVPNSEPS